MSDEVEEWRAVAGYEGRYEVSDWGRVRSLDFYTRRGYGTHMDIRAGRIRKTCFLKAGYEIVSLKKDGVSKRHYVHRLAAEAFIGTSSLEVNHRDGNKANNRLQNLEYVTRQENVDHSIRIGTYHRNHTWAHSRGQNNHNSKITECEATKVTEMMACGFNTRQISEMTGISVRIVEQIHSGKTWRHIPRDFPWQQAVRGFLVQSKGDKKWAS